MHSIDSQKITEGRVSISENLEPIKEPNNGRDCRRGFKDSGHAAIQQTGGAETKHFSTGYCTYTARGALGQCDGWALKGRGHRGITGFDPRSLKRIIFRVYIVLKPF